MVVVFGVVKGAVQWFGNSDFNECVRRYGKHTANTLLQVRA